jgi:hypothetical protein
MKTIIKTSFTSFTVMLLLLAAFTSCKKNDSSNPAKKSATSGAY